MSLTNIRLDTSDFTAWRRADGRINLQVDGPEDTVTLDLDPGVVVDLVNALVNAEEEES